MSEFEDKLWLEIVREHGNELVRAGRPVRRQRLGTRPQVLAGTTVGVAAIAVGAALLFGASTSPAAFAVTRNADGTVTVHLIRSSGIAGANRKLAAMGVRAEIAGQAKYPPALVCPGGATPTITFDPTSIPKRHVLVIAPGKPNAGHGGNHVVRTLPGAVKLRPAGSDGNHAVQMRCP